ncbi:beta strand repeat-containing protein, partial [Methylobacterium cerastii]|uniref:beta strand repeat-containing protein n=1 Tax=Methylobacterium cerastii TaxID=932741 RepID=UPI001EE2E21F
EVFTVTSLDGTTKDITFTITGTNDAPMLAADAGTHIFTEAAATTGSTTAVTLTASLSFTDVDLIDTHTVSVAAPVLTGSGTAGLTTDQKAALVTALTGVLIPGTITDTSATVTTGTIPLSFSKADGAFDFLAAGETLSISYAVTVSDQHTGGTATQSVVITVTGTNDQPVLAAGTGAITERAGTNLSTVDQATATLAFTDVDLSDTHTATASTGFTLGGTGFTALTDAQRSALQSSLPSALTLSSATISDSTQKGAGSASFTLRAQDKTFDFLADGQTLTITYDVTVSDNRADTTSASASKTMTFTVTGSNDAPVLAADTIDTHVVRELARTSGSADFDTATANLTFTDVDLSDTHTVVVAPPVVTLTKPDGTPGTLPSAQSAILADVLATAFTRMGYTDSTGQSNNTGSIGFSFSVADAKLDFLAAGESLNVVYAVTVKDALGATSTQPVTFAILGTNDLPVLSADTSGVGNTTHQITEAAATTGSTTADTATASLTFTDLDLSDTHTVSIAAPTLSGTGYTLLSPGQQATLASALANALTSTAFVSGGANDSTNALSGTGTIPLSFSKADATFDVLREGETLVVTYNVSVTDSQQVTSTQPVTFTITGTNDAAVITVPAGQVVNVTEDGTLTSGNLTATGTLSVTDADHDQSGFQTTVIPATGVLGTLTLAANGAYTYSVDNTKVQYLAAGQPKNEVFTVKSLDGTTKDITFTITGTNDVPVLAADTGTGNTTHQITEAATTTGSTTLDKATASLTFTDVDLADTHTVSFAAPAITGTGYSALNATQQAALVTALTGALATGTIVDSTNAANNTGTIPLTFSKADATFDFLREGETLSVTYDVTVNDKNGGISTQPVTFTITGTNDAAVITVPTGQVVNVTEDSPSTTTTTLTATGMLSVTDADHDQSSFQTIVAPVGNVLGTLTLAANGAYSYSVANAKVQYLAAGEIKSEVFTVKSSDGTSKDITFTITGTNDAPVLAADTVASHALMEQAITTGSPTPDTAPVTLTFTDLDVIDVHTVGFSAPRLDGTGYTGLTDLQKAQLVTALTGALTSGTIVEAKGSTGSIPLTFSKADAAFDFLAFNETLVVTYDVTVSDGKFGTSLQPVTFTITGTNDTPVLSAGNASIVERNATNDTTVDTATAKLTFTDVDLTNTHTVSVASGFTLGGTGYTGLTDTQKSALGTSLTSALSLSPAALTDSNGTGAGSVSYILSAQDKTFDFLAAGQTLTIAYDVTVKDAQDASSTKPMTFTVTGTNDLPVLAADTSGTGNTTHQITEAAATTGSTTLDTATASLTFTDVDLADTHTVSFAAPAITGSGYSALNATQQAALVTALTGALATGTIVDSTNAANNTGTIPLSFSKADATFDFLAKGQVLTVTYDVTVNDKNGGISTQPVSFTINGVNDAAVIGTPTVASVTEDSGVTNGNLVATGSISIADTDTGEATFATTVVKATDALGALVLNTDGTYTYTVANAAVQSLAGSAAHGGTATHVDNFTVSAADGTTKVVSFTINGVNDAAVIGTPTVASVTEDSGVTNGNLVATGS